MAVMIRRDDYGGDNVDYEAVGGVCIGSERTNDTIAYHFLAKFTLSKFAHIHPQNSAHPFHKNSSFSFSIVLTTFICIHVTARLLQNTYYILSIILLSMRPHILSPASSKSSLSYHLLSLS